MAIVAAGAFFGLLAAGCGGEHPAAPQDFTGTTRQQVIEEPQQGRDRTPLIDGPVLALFIAGVVGLLVIVSATVTALLLRLRGPRGGQWSLRAWRRDGQRRVPSAPPDPAGGRDATPADQSPRECPSTPGHR
jgi:hypothetical protein